LNKVFDDGDFYYPVGHTLLEKKKAEKGRIRKYLGKLGERCIPCCK